MLDGGHYKARGTSGIKRKFPWDEMEVGETFTVDFGSSLLTLS